MEKEPQTLIEKILDHARWAPSGDNMQPWRFEVINEKHFVVHGSDTRDHCVYDLQGHASQLAIGALLESIAIAAREFRHQAEFTLRENTPETQPTIDVFLAGNDNIHPDPLFAYLPIRSVQRRVLKTTPLSNEQKSELEQCISKIYTIKWIEGRQGRWQVALLMFKFGKLRLTLPEAYPTHSSIIEWNACFSDDKIPIEAVGLDPITARLMKWPMQSWARVKFLNTYMAGTLLPRIELDLSTGINCAAHFALIAEQTPRSIQDYLNAGRSFQRFWLTATGLGLKIQPEMTPLIFSGYIREKVEFTSETRLTAYSEKLSKAFQNLIGESLVDRVVILGRIGAGNASKARSTRLSIDKLFQS